MKLHKLSPTEIFCCGDGGCGPCGIIERWVAYSDETSYTSDDLRTTVMHEEKVYLSSCCKGSLFVWDNAIDREVSWRTE